MLSILSPQFFIKTGFPLVMAFSKEDIICGSDLRTIQGTEGDGVRK